MRIVITTIDVPRFDIVCYPPNSRSHHVHNIPSPDSYTYHTGTHVSCDERSAQEHIIAVTHDQWWHSSKSSMFIAMVLGAPTPRLDHVHCIPSRDSYTYHTGTHVSCDEWSAQEHIIAVTHDQWWHSSKSSMFIAMVLDVAHPQPRDYIIFTRCHHQIQTAAPQAHTVRVMKNPHNNTSLQ